MTVDARRPSPVDPVDLGVDRQESSELFGDMGDFGDLLGEMLAMETTDFEGTGIPSPSPREKSLGWLATKEEQLDEAEDAACNPDLASSQSGRSCSRHLSFVHIVMSAWMRASASSSSIFGLSVASSISNSRELEQPIAQSVDRVARNSAGRKK